MLMLKTLNTMTGVRTCNPVKRPSKAVCGERRKPCEEPTGATGLVQPFPTEGVLFANLDLTKPELESRLGQLPGKVRSYKMTSVSVDEGLLQQWGSGPNYQGGCLTLCTCAHKIRAEKRNPEEWLHDWWIAGFTSPKCNGGFWLFYLAQIGQVYRSMAELWTALPSHLRLAKSARRNRLGDAYQPNPSSACLDPFDAAHYYPPMLGHSHRKDASDDAWKEDVEFYDGSFKRYDVYLAAKPKLTFLWQTPLLYLEDHPRNKTWDSVAALLTKLLEAV
jgi:hypothetical protein